MKVNIKFENAAVALEKGLKNMDCAEAIMAELRRDIEEYTGWVNWPTELPEEWTAKMKTVAEDIRGRCDKLIVIGVGGSYLGTAAVLDALGGSAEGCPEVLYAGNSLSGNYHARFEQIIKDNDVCLCVVSKSGGTMESLLAFSILKGWMYEKYGREETAKRIVAITDPVRGRLREEADREGYETFEIPGNIGGRYSAFTPAIMFPLAVAGVDIDEFVHGARDIQSDEDWWKNEGVKYALVRYAMLESGKAIEIFEYYDPSMRLIGEWCKQLFGESEGKDGKGLFPASLTFSTDLHSVGQFLQEGNRVFFETVINVLNWDKDVTVPDSAGEQLAGRSLNDINQMAVKGAMAAHKKADVEIVQLELEDSREYCIGQLFYLLMMTAAVTGKLMDVDPFNQPGVEDYKSEIRKLLSQ